MTVTLRRLFVRLGLRFADATDERRFVARFTLDDLARTQAAMVLGSIVYAGFMVWDRILDPSIWTTTTAAIRLGVAGFVLLPLTALLFLKAARRSELRIKLVDEGAGISPDNMAKVFDPFFTTRRDQGSTRLGLHVVYNLVVLTLGGRIGLESRLGEGTRFRIDLPASHQIEGASAA